MLRQAQWFIASKDLWNLYISLSTPALDHEGKFKRLLVFFFVNCMQLLRVPVAEDTVGSFQLDGQMYDSQMLVLYWIVFDCFALANTNERGTC